jgi:hypothetical protein
MPSDSIEIENIHSFANIWSVGSYGVHMPIIKQAAKLISSPLSSLTYQSAVVTFPPI